jgi:hypothetical protein
MYGYAFKLKPQYAKFFRTRMLPNRVTMVNNKKSVHRRKGKDFYNGYVWNWSVYTGSISIESKRNSVADARAVALRIFRRILRKVQGRQSHVAQSLKKVSLQTNNAAMSRVLQNTTMRNRIANFIANKSGREIRNVLTNTNVFNSSVHQFTPYSTPANYGRLHIT